VQQKRGSGYGASAGQSHGHLTHFLKGQIQTQGRGPRSISSSQSKRTNNALIEKAAKLKDPASILELCKISNYQANPLAATLQHKSMGLS
jgi:hypothetical protein